jgi:phage-related minor tail protein
VGYDIGPKIGIEGEKPFRDNIDLINASMRTLGTEMKAVASQFDENDDSTEALTEKNKVLNKQIDLQTDKLSELKKGLASAAEKYGENDRVTQGWRQSVNKATADLNNMERNLKKNDNAIANFGKEMKDTAKDTEKLEKAVDEANKELKEMGSGIASNAAKGIAGIGVAAVGAVGGLLKFGNDSTKALNDFQAQTGMSSEKMEEFRDVASDIYTDNFGESIDDIAESMARVNVVTGQTDDELKKTTETALMMRDTFDFDVAESIDAVNAMMVNFKISADDAYTLIAQGAQQGANKNGDLLDVLREYSPHFSALGLDAAEFTDTLIRGSKSGAFQIDKVGDAVKEFSIRSKDGSKASIEGFELMGLNADDMFEKFSKGGPESAEAFQEVIDKLYEIEDPLLQNQAGVDLFGTMFEDLGVEAIHALGDIGDHVDITADTLQEINDIKYDDLGSSFEELKRGLLTDVADPIKEQLTPVIGDMVDRLKDVNTDAIVQGFTFVIDNSGTIAAGITSIVTAAIGLKVLSSVNTVVGAWKAYKLATDGATIAQWALNAAQTANPIGIVVVVIAALVAGLVVLFNTNEEFRESVLGAWAGIKEGTGKVWDWIVNLFTVSIPDTFNKAVDWFKGIPGKILGALLSGKDKVTSFVPNLFGSIKTKFTSTNWGSLGKGIISGISSGVKSKAKELKDSVVGAAKGAFEKAKNYLDINSPSRLFKNQIGAQIGAGMAEGVKESARKVNSAMDGLNRGLSANIDMTGVSSSAGGLGGGSVVVNIPVELDGKVITKSTGKVQLGKNKSRSRALGVTV